MLAQVAVSRNVRDFRDILTYRVPQKLAQLAQPGNSVMVPLGKGNQQVHGYIVALLDEDSTQGESYKEILEMVEVQNFLLPEQVELAVWISEYYLCSCYYVLEYMLPKYVRSKKQELVCWRGDSELVQAQMLLLEEQAGQLAELVRQKGRIPLATLKKQIPQAEKLLPQLVEAELVALETDYRKQGGSKRETIYESCVEPAELEQARAQLGRAVRQWEVLRYLTYQGASDGKTLYSYWPNYRQLVRELLKKKLICQKQVELQRFSSDCAVFRNGQELVLNGEQQAALDVILAKLETGEPEEILLHGVTGSGKTEVYLRTLRAVLERGEGAMILVPEISLTPQLIGRFRAVLGEYVEVLHSNLSDGERFDAWQRLYKGETRIVVGVRSAVFAPVRRLRLIIMDEEHETTFKQSEPDPRYHARQVARQRMKQNKGLLLLGSATPAVQSYYEIAQGAGTLLTLHKRAKQQPLPAVEIVDMAKEFQSGNRSMFSKQLRQTMEESLLAGEQVILFLNRRGFSSSVVCRECGYTLVCEKCSIALTYHKEENMAKCHYCDFMMPLSGICPNCGSHYIRFMGSGTELVEEEVRRLWPWAVVDRMDLDTTKNKDAHNQILERFARGETQVLIGTQMVAKGLDFPNVTTVGVLAADMILNLPDYTAAERTFQLLTQVAGRAGRSEKPGRVIVQTYNPEHYSIVAAQNHDYGSFYEKEIQMRELMGYPPFSSMVRILVSDYEADGLLAELGRVAEQLQLGYPALEFLGPSEAPISMVRRRRRFHLILKGTSLDLLREAAEYGKKVMTLSRKSKTLRFLIDVEPLSVL